MKKEHGCHKYEQFPAGLNVVSSILLEFVLVRLIIKWEIAEAVEKNIYIRWLVLELVKRGQVSENEHIVIENIVGVNPKQAESPNYVSDGLST